MPAIEATRTMKVLRQAIDNTPSYRSGFTQMRVIPLRSERGGKRGVAAYNAYSNGMTAKQARYKN